MPNNLLDGLSGEVRARARFAHRDNEVVDAPEWGSEREVTLAIERRGPALKGRGGQQVGGRAGDILTLNVRDFAWAEYGERDYCGNNHWLCEEYRMEIIDVLRTS